MNTNKESALPGILRIFRKFISRLNLFFDWLYHSRYNPLYRSGTLAVGMLVVLLITGLYLILFYQISAPYQSLERINNDIPLGWLIRGIHRYATDIMLLAVFFHLLQVTAKAKTWGPHILAWTSGIVLTGICLFTAWTGYVMIWDQHAQVLLQSGLDFLQLVPFLNETLARAFNGIEGVPPSFFFMNLFLHVALPLGLMAGLWMHTMHLARSAWLPEKKIILYMSVVISIAVVFWKAPMLPEANMLKIPANVPSDLLTGFWLGLRDITSPQATLGILILALLFMFSFPLWCRPKNKTAFPASYVDKDECLGCRQCQKDCPYEAITMEPREGKIPVYSFVHSDLCVSCGACMASCDDFAIGPGERSAQEQIEQAKNLIARVNPKDKKIAVIICSNNSNTFNYLNNLQDSQLLLMKIDCASNLHAFTAEEFLTKCAGVLIWTCPEKNCESRYGVELLRERIFEMRHPTLSRKISRERLRVLALSFSERREFGEELQKFKQSLAGNTDNKNKSKQRRTAYIIKSTVTSLAICYIISRLSAWPLIKESELSGLKFIARLPAQSTALCHEPTEAEVKDILPHMRPKQICDTKKINYSVKVTLDSEIIIQTEAKSAERHPLTLLHKDFKLPAGAKLLSVEILPDDPTLSAHKFREQIDFNKGDIRVLDLNNGQFRLF